MVSLDDIRAEALSLLQGKEEGGALDDMTVALIHLGLCAAVTALDVDGIDSFTRCALDAGATAAQVHEVLALVSGLGVHTLMEGSKRVAAVLRERQDASIAAPLDPARIQLRERHVGDDRYWNTFEKTVPGFLDALLRLAPDAFEAFFNYCAVPWKTNALPALAKELISMAVDAAPTHRYLPGMRLHLGNALKLGASRVAILQALDIAAKAPTHQGVR